MRAALGEKRTKAWLIVRRCRETELIHRRMPCKKSKESVELATLEWVHWFNHQRLLELIGYIPQAEAEANYWRQRAENDQLAA